MYWKHKQWQLRRNGPQLNHRPLFDLIVGEKTRLSMASWEKKHLQKHPVTVASAYTLLFMQGKYTHCNYNLMNQYRSGHYGCHDINGIGRHKQSDDSSGTTRPQHHIDITSQATDGRMWLCASVGRTRNVCVSYRVLLFLLPLLLRLSDQLILNLLGDLIVLTLAELPEGSCADGEVFGEH